MTFRLHLAWLPRQCALRMVRVNNQAQPTAITVPSIPGGDAQKSSAFDILLDGVLILEKFADKFLDPAANVVVTSPSNTRTTALSD